MAVLVLALAVAALAPAAAFGGDAMIPDDFPQFTVPGFEQQMDTIRRMYWLHYPGSGPKATLWDEWLPMPSLWPAVETGGSSDRMRQEWRSVLGGRIIDRDGYVATHQHASIAHQLGWPFPFWNQGQGGFGWHFSFKDTVGPPWRQEHLSSTGDWTAVGLDDKGLSEDGWELTFTRRGAWLATSARAIDTFQSPFIQIRWKSASLQGAQPYLEWSTDKDPGFGPARRVYFDPPEPGRMVYSMVPMWKHPGWKGSISGLRLSFDNPAAEGGVTLQAIFTQYDTRHNINSQNFIRGCAHYYNWTGDLSFLRANIGRMRQALEYLLTEHQALERKVVFTDWVGHDGRSGLETRADGSRVIHPGRGIGNNYWDIMPFGGLDCYATIQHYSAVLALAQIERAIQDHPEWNIPSRGARRDADWLIRHAAEVKAQGNRLFWNEASGRFFACVDSDGRKYDYGFTFLNLEAIYYGFASPSHARDILEWIGGERTVESDTSTGADIYYWRFAPRATTRRNLDWYVFGWTSPESIPFGGQVQDGGAVLGFSYHDLMARLFESGPDSAWARLQEILKWFEDVESAGGYRKYYDGTRPGSMQGGGTAGGLGLDQEFFESVMVPQIMLAGFLGFAPEPDGFRIDPRLPADWPQLAIDRIRWQDLTLSLRAARDVVEIERAPGETGRVRVRPPAGDWLASFGDRSGKRSRALPAKGPIEWETSDILIFKRARRS